MTKEECLSVIGFMADLYKLMARLMFGGGLRLMECPRLRVQDLDFSRHEIIVRNGKRAKDRETMLPANCAGTTGA